MDQSTFDTLNVATSRVNFFDEIRIATTFVDAVSQVGGDDEAWRRNFPALGQADEDDDGDSLTNDEERIFGLDPTDPTSSNPFAVPVEATNGTFSHTRRTQSLAELDDPVWFSTDLEDWYRDINAEETCVSSRPGDMVHSGNLGPAWTRPALHPLEGRAPVARQRQGWTQRHSAQTSPKKVLAGDGKEVGREFERR